MFHLMVSINKCFQIKNNLLFYNFKFYKFFLIIAYSIEKSYKKLAFNLKYKFTSNFLFKPTFIN